MKLFARITAITTAYAKMEAAYARQTNLQAKPAISEFALITAIITENVWKMESVTASWAFQRRTVPRKSALIIAAVTVSA